MSKFIKILGIALFVLCAVSSVFAQTNEKITITTYYPSPYGVYNDLRLYPHLPITACTSTNKGAMFYDSQDDKLKYCNGTAWVFAGGWWESSDSSEIHNVNPGNVLIKSADSNTSQESSLTVKTFAAGGFNQGIKLQNRYSTHVSATGVRYPTIWRRGDDTTVHYVDGAFNFGKDRDDSGPTKRHPWIDFEPTYYATSLVGDPGYYSPSFLAFPPVGYRYSGTNTALDKSCTELCREKFKVDPASVEGLGIFCWAATGGPGNTNQQNPIPCDTKTHGLAGLANINCLCGQLNLWENGNF